VELLAKVLTGRNSEASIVSCAMSRTSSRSVDTVFSIMNLVRVTLHPRSFAVDDRIGATIALCQQTGAGFLTGQFFWPSSPKYSIFPDFPRTCEDGQATWATKSGIDRNVNDLIPKSPRYLELDDTPARRRHFRLDDQGYLHARGTVHALSRVTPDAPITSKEKEMFNELFCWSSEYLECRLLLRDIDGRDWAILQEETSRPDAYAFLFGYTNGARFSRDAFAILQPLGNSDPPKYQRISSAYSLYREESAGAWGSLWGSGTRRGHQNNSILFNHRRHLNDPHTLIRIGGPAEYKRVKRCLRHEQIGYLLDGCKKCRWST